MFQETGVKSALFLLLLLAVAGAMFALAPRPMPTLGRAVVVEWKDADQARRDAADFMIRCLETVEGRAHGESTCGKALQDIYPGL